MVRITKRNFSINNELKKFNFKKLKIGSIVSFVGYVRDLYSSNDDSLLSLNLDYYKGMTEKLMLKIEDQAFKLWSLEDIKIIHRVGELKLHDQIVLVLVASRHRDNAFKACEFIIDHLKINAPLWKKEISLKNSRWVDQTEKDILKVI